MLNMLGTTAIWNIDEYSIYRNTPSFKSYLQSCSGCKVENPYTQCT